MKTETHGNRNVKRAPAAAAIPNDLAGLRARVAVLRELAQLETELAVLESRLFLGRSDLHQKARLVVARVCEHFHVTAAEMTSPGRPQRIAWPRQVAMWLIRELSAAPYQRVAGLFDKDHGTVMHACRAVRARMDTESGTRRELEAITRRLIGETGINPAAPRE